MQLQRPQILTRAIKGKSLRFNNVFKACKMFESRYGTIHADASKIDMEKVWEEKSE